ncbi:MAG: bacteriohemerythrin [Ignavibacteria bacterium]
MPFINWNQRYSVGINEIDNQHKKLVNYINELHEAMKAGKAKEALSIIIQNLIKYTQTHFTLEEKYFAQFDYPDTAGHKREHQLFVSKVLDYQGRFLTGSSIVSIEIINFLRDWLIHHICVVDKKYSPFLIERGVK